MPKLRENARAVVAYIVRDGLMLSVPRRNTGEHASPGGRVEDGETPEHALSREVDEEIGCRVISAWRVYSGCVNGFSVQCYRVEIEGEPIAREPGTRIEWVAPELIANGFALELHSVGVRVAGLLPPKRVPTIEETLDYAYREWGNTLRDLKD